MPGMQPKRCSCVKVDDTLMRGSTAIYAHMQAVGMVNDHVVDCYRYRDLRRLRTPT